MSEVWDENWYGPTKTLDVTMAALRRQLSDAAQDQHIPDSRLADRHYPARLRVPPRPTPIRPGVSPDPTGIAFAGWHAVLRMRIVRPVKLIMEPSRDQQAAAVQANTPGGSPLRTAPADGRRVAPPANIASAPRRSRRHRARRRRCRAVPHRSSASSTEPMAPSVAEQVSGYRAVFSAFGGRPVVVRTPDAGADKRLAFLERCRKAESRPWRARIPHGCHPCGGPS